MSGYEFSLVIPTFNSAAYIGDHVREVLAFYERAGLVAEVLIADDGSTDGTADAVPVAPNVRVLRLPHRGKGGALRSGMVAATGDIRAFTDADLPYGIDLVPHAIRWIRQRRVHAVLGDRTLPSSTYESAGLGRTVLSDLASFVFRTMVTGGIYDTQCGFKVFRGDVAGEVFRLARVDGFAIDVEIIYLLLKYRLDSKRIPVQLRENGSSSVHVVRDSLTAVRDVSSIRLNWASGKYRSRLLVEILQEDSRADVDQVIAEIGGRRVGDRR